MVIIIQNKGREMTLTKKALVVAISTLLPFAVQANTDSEQQGNTEPVQKLKTIVVSAALKEQDVDKAPASISVITSEEIERSAALSLADVLQKQAGVYNYNSGQDKIVIRGMLNTSGNYTLILLNGKRMSSNGAMWRGNDFDWSAIPLNSIERVEVIRGPMSSLYGADAMGGVINIITKKAEDGQLHGSIFGQYNRVDHGNGKDQFRYGFNLYGGLTDNLSFTLAGDAYNRDAWYRNGKPDPDGAYFVEKDTKNVNGTLSWNISDQQTLDLDLGYNNDKRPLTQDAATSIQESEMKRTNVGIAHRGKWEWGKTEAYIGKETAKIYDYDSEYDAPQSRQYKQENLIGRAFANFDWLMNNTTAGFDYKDQKITDVVSYIGTGKNQQKSYGVFVQNDTHINDALTLTLGGRYDDFDDFDGKSTGKAYLTYELAEGVILKGGVGQAYKVPSPAQLDINYSMISCGGSCHIRGNPNLDPEESTNYEASLIVTRPNWNAGVTVFQNDVKNLIEAITLSDGDPRLEGDFRKIWTNVSRAELKGVELTGGYDFTDNLGVKANATYLDAKNKTTGKDLTERPEWLANGSISWAPVEDFRVNAGVSYVGKQMYSATKELPAYTTYDVTFTSPLSPRLTLDYGVKNLTDVDLEDKNKTFNTKLYGRNYFVKATYSF